MLWIADEVAQLPSLLAQLIDNCTPLLFLMLKKKKKKKGFGVIFWTLFLVHHNAGLPRLGGNGEDAHVEGRSEELLIGPPEGTNPWCATDAGPPGISRRSSQTS